MCGLTHRSTRTLSGDIYSKSRLSTPPHTSDGHQFLIAAKRPSETCHCRHRRAHGSPRSPALVCLTASARSASGQLSPTPTATCRLQRSGSWSARKRAFATGSFRCSADTELGAANGGNESRPLSQLGIAIGRLLPDCRRPSGASRTLLDRHLLGTLGGPQSAPAKLSANAVGGAPAVELFNRNARP